MELGMICCNQVIIISSVGNIVNHVFWAFVFIVEENSNSLIVVNELLLTSFVGISVVCSNYVLLYSIPSTGHKLEPFVVLIVFLNQIPVLLGILTINQELLSQLILLVTS